MKSQLLSTFSVLLPITIATIFPVPSFADTPIDPSTTKHQSLAFETKKNDDSINGLKQPNNIVPVTGTDSTKPPEPIGSWVPNENPVPTVRPIDGEHTSPEDVIPLHLVTVALHHTQQGASTGHTEQYANYKTWGGNNWTASINLVGEFTHTRQGNSSGHTDTIIQYISWDGQPWTATVNATDGVFTHTQQGASTSHTATRLDYVGWDGALWTMRLQ